MTDHLVKMSADVMDQLWERAKNVGGDSLAFVNFANACAQWGADHQLDVCCDKADRAGWAASAGNDLRAACRPKPPTLAEQGIEALQRGKFPRVEHVQTLRAALKRLAELEAKQ